MKELIVQLKDEVTLSVDEVKDIVEGTTNQTSGFMALKDVCKMENLNTNDVFKWVRNKEWLEEWPEVTAKAYVDWGTYNAFTDTFTIYTDEILIQIINGSHYINTNSTHYQRFMTALREAGIIGGYNRQVKNAKPDISEDKKRQIRELLKVKRIFIKRRLNATTE